MRRLIFFLSVCLVLAMASCSRDNSSAAFYVAKVIDGDTIMLSNGRTVRYIGLDTPEVRKKQDGVWVHQPDDYAIESREFNRWLVEGKEVKLEFDLERTDKYGRWLAYVFVNGQMINQELLRQGYGVLLTFPPNVKYVETLVAAQKEARQQDRGLWKSYQAITSDQAERYIGEFHVVRGRVKSTFESEKVVFLNFGKDWRRDFTAAIFKSNLDQFKVKEIDPVTYYQDKLVEVVGKIKSYNGPEIIINHPSQITVVGD